MRCPKCTSIEDKVIDSRISREGNTIRRRGVNISSDQIDEEIIRHPNILECATVGVPSALGEEDILACIVWRDTPVASVDDIRKREITVGTSGVLSSSSYNTRLLATALDMKLRNPNPDFFSYTMSKQALAAAVTMMAMAAPLSPMIENPITSAFVANHSVRRTELSLRV